MRILVAEDDTITRRVIARALERLGHDCTVAADGDEAWATWQEHRNEIDVVVSDWMMPGLDGPELCRHIRAAETESYVYFIIMTALEAKSNYLTGIQAGADDFLNKPPDRDELNARLLVAERIVSLHRVLREKSDELERLNEHLRQEGRIDQLTGIGNRRRMEEDLARFHDEVQRYQRGFAVALCDIDYFKKYNDSCGHLAGDETLRAVAGMLQQQCRTSDAVYRYGGEEFLLLLPQQCYDGAMVAMERMRAAVEGMQIPHPGKDPAGVVTISGGIACVAVSQPIPIPELLANADAALYRAKETGRNRVLSYADLNSPASA